MSERARVFCAACKAEGESSVVYAPTGGISTLMVSEAFYDREGVYHVHDPNTTTSEWSCSRGHQWMTSTSRPCPADGCTYGKRGPSSDGLEAEPK